MCFAGEEFIPANQIFPSLLRGLWGLRTRLLLYRKPSHVNLQSEAGGGALWPSTGPHRWGDEPMGHEELS